MNPREKTKLLSRLSRIEGQVRGLSRMVEEDRYCVDILNQCAAVHAALKAAENVLIRNHATTCIEGAIAAGDTHDQREKFAELIGLLERR